MTRRLLLVRHARTSSEFTGRYLGATDVPLGEDGLRQANSLAVHLRSRSIGHCVCSPLVRASQTAQIISEATGVAPQIDSDLREVDFGKWEGQTFAQVSSAYPAEVTRWAQFSDDFAFPGGESIRGFLNRIECVANRLAADPAEELLVVTHGGVIRALICHFLGLSPRNYLLFEVRHATLTTIDLFEGRGVLSGLNELSPNT